MWFFTLLALLSVIVPTFINASHVLNAHRAIQLDVSSQGALGSRRTLVSQTGCLYGFKESLTNKVVILPVNDSTVNRELFEQLVDKDHIAAALFVIPSTADFVQLKKADQNRIHSIEAILLEREFNVPTYFIIDDEQTRAVIDELVSGSAHVSDRYQFQVRGLEATPISPSPTLSNLFAWLRGSDTARTDSTHNDNNDAGVAHTPVIAIVANYDALSVAPSLSFGSALNGSGVVALLSLMRLISRLYSNENSRSVYDFVFVLTSGSRLGSSGSNQWLQNIDASLLESLELVLCLEDLSGDDIYMHVSNPINVEGSLHDFNHTAQRVALDTKRNFEVVQSTSENIVWEHEQFTRRHIASATISTRTTPISMQSGTIFDGRDNVSSEKVVSNVQFVGEALCSYVFVQQVPGVASGEAVSNAFVEAWLNFLSTQPRLVPSPTSIVVKELTQVLHQYAVNVKVDTFPLDSSSTLYASSPSSLFEPVPMTAFKLKPFTFDIMLAVSIGSYLFAFYFGVQASIHT